MADRGSEGVARGGPGNGAPASQQAVEALQRRIASGDLPAGGQLPSQRDLAKTLGVSRATLREALSVMETLGLLRVEPRTGVFVRGAGERAAHERRSWRFGKRYSEAEVFELRSMLETSAARLAALSGEANWIEPLTDTLAAMKAAAREQIASRFADADFAFHHTIVQAAGNRLLIDMHAGLRPLVVESQRLPLAYPAEFWDPIREHERILEALRLGDPDGAEYYMKLHLTRAAERAGAPLRA